MNNRIPPLLYPLPSKSYKDKNKKSGTRIRSCQHKWFQTFEFLAYSSKMKGLFCLPCILFPVENVTGGRAQQLITKPYNNWKDALVDLRNHASCEYHNSSAILLKNFMATADKKTPRINEMLDDKIKEQILKNRKVLHSILRCIEYCGRQGVALRGHRDDNIT